MTHAEVSFTSKQAVVRYRKDRVGVAEMVAAIKRIGFSARLRDDG